MRHPFAGINIPQSTETQATSHSTQFRPTRRAIVQGMLGGLSLAALPWEASADEQAEPTDQPNPAAAHDRYLVVPADYRKFTAMRRKELNVLGNFFNPAAQSRDQRRTQGGFLAWLTPEEVQALQRQPDVASVKRLMPDDIPTPQESARKGDQHILVRLLPGDWKIKPKAGTYQTAAEIQKAWQQAFAGYGIDVLAGPQDSMLVLEVGTQEVPPEVLAAVKEHPQVVGLQWMAAPASRPGNPGGVTTEALGEEGAATTLALGEEGNQPTTLALGEEGGPRPPRPQRPRPGGVTTFALGEEG